MVFTIRSATWTDSLSRIMFTKRNLYVHILTSVDNWYAIVKCMSSTTPRFVTVNDAEIIFPHNNTWMFYQMIVSLGNKYNKLYFIIIHNHLTLFNHACRSEPQFWSLHIIVLLKKEWTKFKMVVQLQIICIMMKAESLFSNTISNRLYI